MGGVGEVNTGWITQVIIYRMGGVGEVNTGRMIMTQPAHYLQDGWCRSGLYSMGGVGEVNTGRIT